MCIGFHGFDVQMCIHCPIISKKKDTESDHYYTKIGFKKP